MFLGVLVFIVLTDQITKFLAYVYLQPQNTVPVINNFFYLTYHENTGAVFGILRDNTGLLDVIAAFIILTLVYYLYRNPKEGIAKNICLSLLVSGILGNMIDRIRLGFVIDLFDFQYWPLLNLADMSLVAGGILLMLITLLQSPKKE
jgi:signal peptidase II